MLWSKISINSTNRLLERYGTTRNDIKWIIVPYGDLFSLKNYTIPTNIIYCVFRGYYRSFSIDSCGDNIYQLSYNDRDSTTSSGNIRFGLETEDIADIFYESFVNMFSIIKLSADRDILEIDIANIDRYMINNNYTGISISINNGSEFNTFLEITTRPTRPTYSSLSMLFE